MAVLLLWTVVGLTLLMAAGWAFQRARGNGGWTDVFWSFGVGAAGAAAALWPLEGRGPSPRQVLAAALALGWCLRLGVHILRRVVSAPEDARYALMRERLGPRFQAWMAAFLPGQALASLPLLLSILLAARNPTPGLGLTDLAGALILALAVLGEGAADRQLEAFKADPDNHGRVCDRGLWAWSRHPNYFFEWLGWLAWPVMALAGGWPPGWLALAGPAAMFLILVLGTGVPPLEAHMRRSRGAAYEAYARRTSVFLPLPPRRSTETEGA